MKIASMSAMAIGIMAGVGAAAAVGMSRHSRNRHVGEELGRGKTLEEITHEMGMVVAEGVKTAISAHMLAQRKNCDTPITNAVFNVLYNNLSARDAVRALMTRDARVKERKKPGQPGARRRFQFSKR